MRQTTIIIALLLLGSGWGLGQCGTVLTGPVNEDFDGATPTTSASCSVGNPGTYPSGWSLTDTGNAWRVRAGATSSIDTGPSEDVTGSFCAPGNYVYIETSGSCAGTAGTLNAPCINISGVSAPCVTFRYHMYGATMGTLEVQVKALAGGWSTIWSRSGDQGDAWRYGQALIDVIVDPAALEVRFVGTAGSSFTSDMALDDVTIGLECAFPDWQVNTPVAHADANGVETGGFVRPRSEADMGMVTISSANVGEVWDLIMSDAELVPVSGGGLQLYDQIVNLDITSNLSFLNGGENDVPFPAAIPGLSSPVGTITIPYCMPSPTTVSFQSYHAEASSMIGLVLSQGVELKPGPIEIELTDDDAQTLDLSCFCPGGIPFYGTSQDASSVTIDSNGRILFGSAGADVTATIADALQGVPSIGFWTDLDPGAGGGVTFSRPATGVIRFDFVCVPYYSESAKVTWGVEFDCGNGVITMDGLLGIEADPGVTTNFDNQLLGMSPGVEAGATDSGTTLFANGSSGGVTSGDDMLYDFLDYSTATSGLVTSLQAGNLDGIVFTPDSNNDNYTWYGF